MYISKAKRSARARRQREREELLNGAKKANKVDRETLLQRNSKRGQTTASGPGIYLRTRSRTLLALAASVPTQLTDVRGRSPIIPKREQEGGQALLGDLNSNSQMIKAETHLQDVMEHLLRNQAMRLSWKTEDIETEDALKINIKREELGGICLGAVCPSRYVQNSKDMDGQMGRLAFSKTNDDARQAGWTQMPSPQPTIPVMASASVPLVEGL
ncbi:hypothetical protein DFH29DRAFT_1004188 [Suillus ampliporus]|nr:hypothetical protein DFH29DRAFT_1004188 [Suillus ampliporus]